LPSRPKGRAALHMPASWSPYVHHNAHLQQHCRLVSAALYGNHRQQHHWHLCCSLHVLCSNTAYGQLTDAALYSEFGA